MAAWAGPQVPFVLDYSAPWLPLIQGPQAFLAGLSQSRRQSQAAESQAKSQLSQQEAAQWGATGRSLGFLGGAGIIGLTNPTALTANNNALLNAFAASTAVGGGGPIAQYVGAANQNTLDQSADFTHQYGVSPEQATQIGQRVYENAPQPIQLELLKTGGFSSPDQLTALPQDQQSTFYKSVGANTISGQRIALQNQAQTQAIIARRQAEADAAQASGTIQAIDAGTVQLPQNFQQEWNRINSGLVGLDNSINPAEQQALVREANNRKAQIVQRVPRSALIQVKSPQQQANESAVTVNGRVLIPKGGKSGGYMDLGPDDSGNTSKWPQGRGVGDVWNEGGVDLTRDHRGDVKVLNHGGSVDFGAKEYADLYTKVLKQMSRPDENGNEVAPSPEQVEQVTRGVIDGFQRYKSGIKSDMMGPPSYMFPQGGQPTTQPSVNRSLPPPDPEKYFQRVPNVGVVTWIPSSTGKPGHYEVISKEHPDVSFADVARFRDAAMQSLILQSPNGKIPTNKEIQEETDRLITEAKAIQRRMGGGQTQQPTSEPVTQPQPASPPQAATPPPQKPSAVPATAKRKVGDAKILPNGLVYKWDGKMWVLQKDAKPLQ